jgi:hypothetical protein
MPIDLNNWLNQRSGLISVIGLLASLLPIIHGVGLYALPLAPLTIAERLELLLEISIIVLIAHGTLWALVERKLHWDYATGSTPKKWHAVVMSLTLTVPAFVIPALYQRILERTVLSNSHVRASMLGIVGGALAYVALFGLDHNVFPGIRELVLRRFVAKGQPHLGEVVATFAYSVGLILCIAAPYRALAFPNAPFYSCFTWPLLASLIVFFGLTAYLLLKSPESFDTATSWGFLRGVIAGMFTVVSICTALYT